MKITLTPSIRVTRDEVTYLVETSIARLLDQDSSIRRSDIDHIYLANTSCDLVHNTIILQVGSRYWEMYQVIPVDLSEEYVDE